MIAAILKGIPVKLYERVQTGTDLLNRPVYQEVPVTVENVLVSPVTGRDGDIQDDMNLAGRRGQYNLGIPKGDTHNWVDRKVEFFGQTFQTFGQPVEGIEAMIPLDWNKLVKCEVINGEG